MESRAEKRSGAVPENSEKKTLKKKSELKNRKVKLTERLTSQKENPKEVLAKN